MIIESKVRSISARLVLDHLKKAKIDVEPLLSQAGLRIEEVCKEDGWVPFYNHARFLDVVAEALDDPCFALELAYGTDPREFGALTYVGIASKTLEDLLQNLKQYMRVVTGSWNMDITHSGERVILDIIPDQPDFFEYQLATEWLIANLIRGYQFSVVMPCAPLEVCFVAPLVDQKKLPFYEKYMGCKARFGQERCQVILKRECLQLPIKNSDDRLLKVLKSCCDRQLKQHDFKQSDFAVKVRERIIDLLPSGRAKASFIATELELTERTMLRRLAEESTTFTEVRDAIRRDLSEKYIQDKRLSLKQITYLLGYSDQSAFSVAFKRWNGTTPKKTRTAC